MNSTLNLFYKKRILSCFVRFLKFASPFFTVLKNLTVLQEEIFTTSFLAAAYLKSIGFQKKVYLYGSKGIADELSNHEIPFIGLGVSSFYGLTRIEK